MCWISKSRPIIQIADSDILVEKVLNGGDGFVHSPVYTGHFWKLGVNYSVALGEPHLSKYDAGSFVVESGFHSCALICHDRWFWKSVGSNGAAREMFNYRGDEYVYSAVIPSGSHYYVNDYGEYVSDRLKIIGKKIKLK